MARQLGPIQPPVSTLNPGEWDRFRVHEYAMALRSKYSSETIIDGLERTSWPNLHHLSPAFMRLSVSSSIATPQKLRLSPSASWYWLRVLTQA